LTPRQAQAPESSYLLERWPEPWSVATLSLAAHGWALRWPQSLPIPVPSANKAPDNIQGIYLDSLRVLAFEEHDIRFVEDNWEDATVGAWGTGWEVWLDGMEVPSLPTFNSVEDLIVVQSRLRLHTGWSDWLYLQQVEAITKIRWTDNITWRCSPQGEIEQCTYFEASNPDMLLTLFGLYEPGN